MIRHGLHLNDDELAVLVGGSASRALFEHYEAKAEASGSASVQALIEEDSHVLYEGTVADHPLLSRALANPEIRKLISAPILVCTVNHLAPATESLRAGRHARQSRGAVVGHLAAGAGGRHVHGLSRRPPPLPAQPRP